jgi:hypothetical protein
MWEKILNFILRPYYWYKQRKIIKNRLKELRERDPFIYK